MALALLQIFVMVFGPLAISAWFRARFRLPWSMWAIGAAGFVASQLVHFPLLAIVPLSKNLLLRSLVLGLLAGACEEPARYVVFRYVLKRARTSEDGIFTGLGHGGIESILTGVAVGMGLSAATLAAPATVRLLAVFERAGTVTFHVAMSLLVLAAVRRGRPSLLVLAIGLHALADAGAVYMATRRGLLAAELVVLCAASISLAFILFVRRADRLMANARTGVVDHPAAPATDRAISTRGLTKEFGDRTAVAALDLDVAKGTVFAMLGPNGAGKTTTVRMLCALIPPSRGTARVAGALLVSEEDQLRNRVGILTETPGLYERLTAYENLELFGRLYGLDPATRAARIEKHLRAFDVWERRNDACSGFSKGMKQKIAIVRALIHEPEVLFLDEPTSGLDPIASREVHDMILALKKQGRTILLTTHRLAEAEELADLVGFVRGKLLALDTVENLKAKMFGKEVRVRVGNPSETLRSSVAGRWDNDVLTVTVDDYARDTPALVRSLVGNGADIVSVEATKHSLEEIYLELVQEKSS